MYLFVYGTLRKGASAYDYYLKDYVVHRFKGYVKGCLYQVKGASYPALLKGDRYIVGDVFEVNEDFDFYNLDQYEGYYGKDDPDNLYDRKEVELYNQQHERIGIGYCYFYRIEPEYIERNLTFIESNDFFK
ncbi:MAG: gamma-glutamylcyclotransferase family protein [Erysipelotrichaceae bacterium]|nr:gamma-glutamylcyclotransferase family protein [Erysipelotrichaceae bacterium]